MRKKIANQNELRSLVRTITENTARELVRRGMIKEDFFYNQNGKQPEPQKELPNGPSKPQLIGNEEGYKVYSIDSYEAMRKACNVNGGSNWDTVEEQYYEMYARKGNFYLIMGMGEKYLALVVNGRLDKLQDSSDAPVNSSELPSGVLNLMGVNGGMSESRRRMRRR